MSKRLTTQEFIVKAQLVHGNLYDYSKVNYKTAHSKVIILCNQHGEFQQIPASHLKGYGCNPCALAQRMNVTQSNTVDFISKAKSIHGNLYDYSKVDYINSHRKVIIICKQHGDFLQKPNNHLSGKNCVKCAYESITSNTNAFIHKAQLIHGDLYSYTQVAYTNDYTKVHIICKEHGAFYQRPGSHLQGHGCPMCGKIQAMNIGQSKSETEFLDWLEVPNDNRQYPIGKYFVDGVVNNTIYEFLGDYWHGHGRLEKGLNYIDIQIKRWLTQHRFSEIQKLTGFNIKYVWESDWNEFNKVGGRLKLRTFDGKMEW